MKDLISVKELALALSVSPQTVLAQAKAGHIPSHVIGKRLRFSLGAVLEKTAQPTTSPSPETPSAQSTASLGGDK